jgi:E3 ubiquitin-protein ligase UBR1
VFLLELASNFDYKYTKDARRTLKNKLTEICGIYSDDLKVCEAYNNHYKRTCVHQFLRGETCWRCLTCGYDETCALCRFCFHEEDHIGHDVHKSIIQRDFAGCCDCGDEEAYANSKCCLYTQPPQVFIKTPVNYDLINHVNNFLGILVDFIIDFTNHSVSSLSPSERADQIRLRHQMCVLNQKVYHGIDYDTPKYALVLYSDQVHQYRDAIQRIRTATGKVKEFAEMVANRCNQHGRAVVMVSENIQFLLKKQEIFTSTEFTACVKNVREVFREEMCDDIIDWIYDFSQSNIAKYDWDLRCTISKSFLSPYKCGCMNQWLDVYYEKVLLNPRCLRATDSQSNNANVNTISASWDLPDQLKEDTQYYDDIKDTDIYNGSRLQFLLLFDIRFCKSTRIKLHNIYIPLIAKNAMYGKMLVAQFIDVYDTILTLFLLVDREPEFSVMPLLTTQLFSSPSNSSLILKHGDINKMIKTIYNYVTTGQTNSILQAHNLNPNTTFGVVFTTLKNRKWAHVLLDLTYLITRNPDIDNIFTFFLCFPQYVHLLGVFQGKPIFRREAEKHIEYESQDYTVFFNAVSVISHFSENIGKVLNRVGKERLLSQGNSMDCWYHSYSNTMVKPFTETLYTIIIRKMIETTFGNKRNADSFNRIYQKVIDESEDPVIFSPCKDLLNFTEVDFNVMEGIMSFLHPLHNMFSWMIEMDQSMDSGKTLLHLMDIIQGEYEYFLSEQDESMKPPEAFKLKNYEGVMGVFDIPLRKIVLISQIKSGLWVRNGTSLKSQMNLYRHGSSREFGFMRDLFLCQIYIGYFRYAQLVTHSLFDRWQLLPWVEGKYEELIYPTRHLHSILEEFVLFMIALVSEDLHLHKLSADSVSQLMIQNEIVHSLCYDSKTYKEIVSCIPDHICSLKKFPIIFHKCVEPVKEYNDISDEKLYRLKENLIETIDPYYIHFNSNRRDHCITKMKEFISRRDNIPISHVVIQPKRINWDDSPFERVVDVLLDEKVLLFLFHTLLHCKVRINDSDETSKHPSKESEESLLSVTLHLTHIAMMHKNMKEVKPIELLKIFGELFNIYDSNVVPDLNAKLKAVMKLIYDILQVMSLDISTEIPTFNSQIFDSDSNVSMNDDKSISDLSFERKKKIARRNKNKLLAKLKKQREKFAANFMIDDQADTFNSDTGSEMVKSIESIQDFKISSTDEISNNNMVDSSAENKDLKYLDTNIKATNVDEEDDHNKSAWNFPEHTCLLCHMPSADEKEVFGVFSYITESNEFRYVPTHNDYWFYKAFGGSCNLDSKENSSTALEQYAANIEKINVIGPGFPALPDDINSSGYNDNMAVFNGCSHGMHVHCFKEYYETSVEKQIAQITRTVPENIQRKEFVCPLCKSINNVFIPICYSKNTKKFSSNFNEQLSIETILHPKLDEKFLKNPTYLDRIKEELMMNVKTNMRPNDWFITEEICCDNSKKYTFNNNSKIPAVLKDCLLSVTLLSPPFESFGLAISRTIESFEILLRGEGYNKEYKGKELIISQLNNRWITSLRIWLQISEIFKCTLGIKREEVAINDNSQLYPQSLLGLYSNLLEDDSLLFAGQDYFTGLIHCEEAKCLGFPFQKLVGIFFGKHIKQSLMKVMLILMKRNELIQMGLKEKENVEILKTNEFKGKRGKLSKIIQTFMNIENIHEDAIDIIYSMTLKLITPFLRKCLILGYAKYAVFDEKNFLFEEGIKECDKICDIMKIPRFDLLVEHLHVEFFQNVNIKQREELIRSKISYPNLVRLIHLPVELNDFYTEFYNKLPDEKKYDEPAICLVCAEIVDLQKTRYGDEYGSCSMHLRWECINGGRGMFFLPRNNCCLLLDNGKGSFIDSPYRTEYGEVDRECKKGHNVFLSDKKYEDFQKKVWLTHNIPNVIAQKLDNLTDIGGWNTL